MCTIMRKTATVSNIASNPTERPSVLEHVSGNVRRLRLQAGLSQEAGPRGQCQPADAGGHRERRTSMSACRPSTMSPPPSACCSPTWSRHRPPTARGSMRWPGSATTRKPRHPLRQRTGAARGGTLGLVAGTGRALRIEPDAAGWREMVLVIEGRLRLELADGVCIEAGDFMLRQRPAVRLRQRRRRRRGGAFHPQRGELGSSLEPAFQRRPR